MNPNIEIPPEEFETIERYILQQMPAEEYEAFTLRLENDEVVQTKVESVRLLLLGVQEVSLENKMKDFHTGLKISMAKKSSTGKIISMKRWLVAASVFVIAGLGVLLFLNQSTKNEKLFAAYYKPDPGLISAMGTSDNYLFDRAMIDYKTEKYDSAIKAWENLLTAKPDNDTLNYFIGSAYMTKEKNDKAIAHFKKVISQTNSYFLKDAYWYTGLALMKDGKIKEAIPFIEKSEHQNKEALLLKLKK